MKYRLKSIVIFLSAAFLSISVNANAQTTPIVTPIAGGLGVAKGQPLVSQDGRFKLILQTTDGNLVLYQGETALWSPHLEHVDPKYPYPNAWYKNLLVFQTDGNLVVYGGTTPGDISIAIWSSGTDGNPNATLNVQSDGNLVISSSTGRPLWSTKTCCH